MDGIKLTLRIIGVVFALIGAAAAIYYAATKIINKTRYFCDDDADFIECDCCDCEAVEEIKEEETAEETTEE